VSGVRHRDTQLSYDVVADAGSAYCKDNTAYREAVSGVSSGSEAEYWCGCGLGIPGAQLRLPAGVARPDRG
jgi:hypothetical protein